jgi:hypothetical protein
VSAQVRIDVFPRIEAFAVRCAPGAQRRSLGVHRRRSVPKSDHSAAGLASALTAGYAAAVQCAHSSAHKERETPRLRCTQRVTVARAEGFEETSTS